MQIAIAVILIFALIFTLIFVTPQNIDAYTVRDYYDLVEVTVYATFESDNELQNMSAIESPIYNFDLNRLGSVFEILCFDGLNYVQEFAIVFDADGVFEISEISYGKYSPYYGHEGMYIYPALRQYVLLNEEGYFLLNNYELELIEEIDEIPVVYGFSGTKDNIPVSFSFSYIRTKVTTDTSKLNVPAGLNGDTIDGIIDNYCGPVAGLTVINYFDTTQLRHTKRI